MKLSTSIPSVLLVALAIGGCRSSSGGEFVALQRPSAGAHPAPIPEEVLKPTPVAKRSVSPEAAMLALAAAAESGDHERITP